MAYATADDLLTRYDSRRVADLVSDTGARSVYPNSSPVVAVVLEDASGMIDAACRVAKRYTTADLNSLTGSTKSLLVRLTCDLAFGLLVARRGYSAQDQKVMAPQTEAANALLEQLRTGERIFDDAEVANAGVNVLSRKTTTDGFHTGTDLVGRSQRLWGRRNLT